MNVHLLQYVTLIGSIGGKHYFGIRYQKKTMNILDDNKKLLFVCLFVYLLPSSDHLDVLQALSGNSLPL